MSMLKLNRKNLHCSPQSSALFTPPPNLLTKIVNSAGLLQSTTVYLASVEMKQKSERNKSRNGQSGAENEESSER